MEKYVKVKRIRTRTRKPIPETRLVDVPFVRVTPKGSQLSLGRDALVILGRPPKILWELSKAAPADPKSKLWDTIRIRLVAARENDASASVISYGKVVGPDGSSHPRPAGLTTLPPEVREVLMPRRYWVVAWSGVGVSPRWVEFTPKSTVPSVEVAAAIAKLSLIAKHPDA